MILDRPLETLTISICGPTGSGKSTVAKALVDLLGSDRSVRIPGDWFLVPASGSLEEYWQQPHTYDWDLLAQVLNEPVDAVFGIPDFDFERFLRRSVNGGARLIMRPLRVVDTLTPYPAANLVVRLLAPPEIRLMRLIERDQRWGTTVIDRWEHLEQSQQQALDGDYPVVEIDGIENPDHVADKIVETIQKLS